ncbi:MAG TPA: response regulator transcription factor [Nitrospiria bacterium]|nr:response regulator transcription factor [Nitrospiria bacterium]
MTLRLVLADDHPVVRKGLRALLEAEPDFRVAGEAADGLEAVKLIEQQRPDVLIVDWMMPGLGGLEVIRQTRNRSPQTRCVVLSMHANEAYVLEALKNGASGYVLKEESHAAMVEAVRAVSAGRRYLSPPLSEKIIERFLSGGEAAAEDSYEKLTDREREVLHLAAEGRTNSEIADRLCVSPRTVETHRAHLMQKLGLKNQTELIRFALRRGILPKED